MSDLVDEISCIRPGCAVEASLLTELALRSKGYWDYDPEFLGDCRAELTITSEFVASNVVFVVEEKGIVVGFYSLESRSEVDVELVHLFVEPEKIGAGYGKQLMRHAAETARRLGFQEMMIKSDPYSESFYKAMGARRIGEVESTVRPGRMLPLLCLELAV